MNLYNSINRRQEYIKNDASTTPLLMLDFTTEPGVITNNTLTTSGDSNWHLSDSPLTQQIKYFLSAIKKQGSTLRDIEACLYSVSCSEAASNILRSHEAVVEICN